MSLKTILAKKFANYQHQKQQKWLKNPVKTQQRVFDILIINAQKTHFGQDHFFNKIITFADFQSNVPVRDYEGHRPYIEKIKQGQRNILWPGLPLYFAKTSGTTSGAKYIPITKQSMPFHINAARDAILSYIHETGCVKFVDGKMIFLQGNPILQELNGIKLGRLSGIVAHYVPKYLQKNRMPSYQVNCIEDWETKVDAIVKETISENMTVISGIPSWVQMYFEKLKNASGKSIGELFPNFKLFIYGGINYEPYRAKMETLIGRSVDSIELYPASEGFFAYQDTQSKKGMLLLLNAGIFYEFIKTDEFFNYKPKRHTIGEVELNVNYVLIISTNAGLWAYNIGDTIMFTSLKPHRIIVTGRINHFISAFGEHVIGKEVEEALLKATINQKIQVTEFTVAPQVNPAIGLPYHEWFIEFENTPENLNQLACLIDEALQAQNIYYKDLISGHILQTLKISAVKKDGFKAYMQSQGKLGGQNKLPRLSNNRNIADFLTQNYLI